MKITEEKLSNTDIMYRVETADGDRFKMIRELSYPFCWLLYRVKETPQGPIEVRIDRNAYRNDLFSRITSGAYQDKIAA